MSVGLYVIPKSKSAGRRWFLEPQEAWAPEQYLLFDMMKALDGLKDEQKETRK
ncbi:MAG: hypothetical protein Q4P17_04040 [Methanobacterium sp.]|nr:hypothetical protein [Methanobacterium sp.]